MTLAEAMKIEPAHATKEQVLEAAGVISAHAIRERDAQAKAPLTRKLGELRAGIHLAEINDRD